MGEISESRMMISVPDFDYPHFGALVVCCFLETKDQKILDSWKELPGPEDDWVAIIGRGEQRFCWRVSGGGEPGHIHVDLIRKQYFKGKKNKDRSDIEHQIEKFAGQTAVARIGADFFVPTAELPEDRGVISAALKAKVSAGEITMKQTGGTLTISGGPVEAVEWMLRKDEKEVRIELRVIKEVTIGSEYLVKAYELVLAAFKLLILGEQKNESNIRTTP